MVIFQLQTPFQLRLEVSNLILLNVISNFPALKLSKFSIFPTALSNFMQGPFEI